MLYLQKWLYWPSKKPSLESANFSLPQHVSNKWEWKNTTFTYMVAEMYKSVHLILSELLLVLRFLSFNTSNWEDYIFVFFIFFLKNSFFNTRVLLDTLYIKAILIRSLSIFNNCYCHWLIACYSIWLEKVSL